VSLAWLLENRRHTPKSKKGTISDPYKNQLSVAVVNYWVAGKLGGWGAAFASQKLTRNDIETIWDDRVLNRAYEIFGGTPQVVIEAANEALPGKLKNLLTEMTIPPA